MKTSWNQTKSIEDYITGKLTPEEELLFDVKMLINPLLRLQVMIQKKVYILVRQYARKKIRSEIEAVHDKIFHDPARASFQAEIRRHFF